VLGAGVVGDRGARLVGMGGEGAGGARVGVEGAIVLGAGVVGDNVMGAQHVEACVEWGGWRGLV